MRFHCSCSKIIILGSFLLLFILFVFPLNSPTVIATGSSISISPGSGAPGVLVTVDGYFFTSGDTVTISLCGSSSCTPLPTTISPITVSSTGSFSASVTIPTSTALGAYRISATDGINTATAPFDAISGVTAGAGISSFQRQLVYSNGLWWAFWRTSSGVDYATSSDGISWQSPAVLTGTANTGFSLWQSGTTLYYVLANSGSSQFSFGTGTLSSTGTITSPTEVSQSTTNPVNGEVSITADSSGDIWLGVSTYATMVVSGLSETQSHLEVWLLDSTTNSWSKVNDIAGPAPTCPYCQSYFDLNLVPLSADQSGNPQVGLVYENSQLSIPEISTANLGTSGVVTWTAPIQPTTTSGYTTTEGISATSIGNVIYVSGISGINTVFFTYSLGQTTSPTETTLSDTNPSQFVGTSIEQGPSGSGSLVIFYGNGNSGFFTESTNFGASWSAPTQAFKFVTSFQAVSAAYSSSPSSQFGVLAEDYEGGSPGTFLDFGVFSLTSTLTTSSTSVTCSPSSAYVNAPIVCTATVTGAATAPSGTVSFSAISGYGSFTTPSCEAVSNTLQCSTTYTPASGSEGSQNIGASYLGDSTYSGSSGSFYPLTVNQRSTTTSVSCPSTVSAGSSGTCQVTVADSTNAGAPITPTGTVSFTSSLGVSIASCTLASGSCTTSYSPSSTQTGSDTMIATYSGDIDHIGSNNQANIGVSAPPPSTEAVSITLNQFYDSISGYLGTPLSGSNYFTVTYVQSGSEQTVNEPGGTISIDVDQNTQVTISPTSSASGSSEQWCLYASSDGTCQPTTISVGTSPVTATYVYFDLQVQFVKYVVSGGGNPLAPPFGPFATAPLAPTRTSNALPVTLPALSDTSYTKIWVMAGSVEDYLATTNANPGSFERWQASPTCDVLFEGSIGCGSYVSTFQIGPFTQGGVFVTITYYNQWEELAQFSIAQGPQASGYTPPTLTYVSLGLTQTTQLAMTSTPVWVDSGSSWSVSSILTGSSSSEKWTCSSDCSGTVPGSNMPLDILPLYLNQVLVTFQGEEEWTAPSAGLCATPSAEGTVGAPNYQGGPPVYVWCGPYPDPGALQGTPYASGQAYFDVGIPTVVSQYQCPTGSPVGNAWSTDTPAIVTITTTSKPGNCIVLTLTANGPGGEANIIDVFYGSGSAVTCSGPVEYVGRCFFTTISVDPAYVLVTAPGGGQVGCDANGNPVETLASATVASCTTSGTGTIIIPFANPGTFTIQTFAIPGASASYNVQVNNFDIDGNLLGTSTISGTAPGSQTLSLMGDGSVYLSSNNSGATGVPEFGSLAGIGSLVVIAAIFPVLIASRRRMRK